MRLGSGLDKALFMYARNVLITSIAEGMAWPSKRDGSADIAFSALDLITDMFDTNTTQLSVRRGDRKRMRSCAEHEEDEHLNFCVSIQNAGLVPSVSLTSPQSSSGVYIKWCNGASAVGHFPPGASFRKSIASSTWHLQFRHIALAVYVESALVSGSREEV